MQSQGLRQVQKQTQNLVLAPQLRQSLKILQVPALELRSAILEELQTNPLLEEFGTNDESLDAEVEESSLDEIETEEFPEEKNEATESSEETNEEIELSRTKLKIWMIWIFPMNLPFSRKWRKTSENILKVNMKEKQNWETLRRKKKKVLFRFSGCGNLPSGTFA